MISKTFKYDIKCDSSDPKIKNVYKKLNELHNKYPYTMLKYCEKVVDSVK